MLLNELEKTLISQTDRSRAQYSVCVVQYAPKKMLGLFYNY